MIKRIKILIPLQWPAFCPECGKQTFYFESPILAKDMKGRCSSCKQSIEVEVIGVDF